MSLSSRNTVWRLVNAYLRYILPILLLLFVNVNQPKAQGANFWSAQKRIPNYPDFAQEPPFIIADQNHTIHAFNAQPLNLDEGDSPKAIFYRQWTKIGGWTNPNDIIYNSKGGGIDILGVASDSSGMVYLIYQQDSFDIYFSYAYLVNAGSSSAWSSPILIAGGSTHVSTGFEGVAAIGADNNGNIVVIYSGSQFGEGLYSVNSSDHGITWSEPYPIYLTGDETVVVTDPALSLGQSGNFHSVWTTYLSDGSAGPGYYARFAPDTKEWNEPVPLDVPGIRTPDVIEYDGKVIVSYYHANVNGNWWRLSNDGGESWSLPSQISSRHVGTNGRVSFAVDSKNNLYAFFGERINDLNHGMWQCLWTGYSWTTPEPVVKGPQVRDAMGGSGFDPRAARAIVSNGNVILVTWATDGFAGVNGAWYSYKQVDAPELPAMVLPAPTSLVQVAPTVLSDSNTSQLAVATATAGFELSGESPRFAPNPQLSIIIGIIPVLLILLGAILIYYLRQNRSS
jgi:hypothetical protein